MGQVTGTNGYPTVPNWSPRYSYGTLYGTGLYSSGSYSTIPVPHPLLRLHLTPAK